MKVKDLLKFNPEADITLLGTNYIPIELEIYGWDSEDCSEDTDTKQLTKNICLIPQGLNNKYQPEFEC